MNVDFLNLQRLNASFGQALTDAVCSVVNSGWYVHGTATTRFEREFADYTAHHFCVGTGNGLDALTLTLLALKERDGWSSETEVIVPANSFIATALAVSRAGLKVVFCDVDRTTALLDSQHVSALITPATRCIVPVHLYGQRCAMDALRSLAARHGLFILHDACQAHGTVAPKTDRSHRGADEAECYSFYPGKNLGALGDGGCVVTDDEALAAAVRRLANYGQQTKYIHTSQGLNSRLDELQAAVLSVKLGRLNKDNARRREIAAFYTEQLQGSCLTVPTVPTDGSHVFHVYAVRAAARDALQSRLNALGVQTLIHYPIPIHRQGAYASYASCSLPEAERWSATELSLPISQTQTDEEAEAVVRAVRDSLSE